MALKKANILTSYLLKAFSSDSPQSVNFRIRVLENTMKNIYPVVDRNRPIRKMLAQDRFSWPVSAGCLKKNYHWNPRVKINSFCLHNGSFFVCM